MPARRRKQSNAMLYTLITFVGLFITATTIAVIYYVQAEDYRTKLADTENQINDLADIKERNSMGTIVGKKPQRTSWLGTMVGYLDQTLSLIVGGVAESTSAEVKINNVNTAILNAMNTAKEHIDIADPNTTGLVQIIGNLAAELNNILNSKTPYRKTLMTR